MSFPISPEGFKDGYKNAIDIGGGFGFNLSPKISLLGNLNYKRFQSKEKYWMLWKEYDEEKHYKATVISLFCDLRFNLNRKRLYPYLLVSAGLTVIDRLGGFLYKVDANHTIDGTTIRFGFGGGFGLNFKINNRSNLFFESRYTTICFYENDGNFVGYLPVRLGLSFNI
jgi:hypothetical protein